MKPEWQAVLDKIATRDPVITDEPYGLMDAVAYAATLRTRISELEAVLDATIRGVHPTVKAAERNATEAALRWAMDHVRGWHKGNWYGNEDETDSAYIQRGIAALLDGRGE